jgi:hypothetical protein
MNAVRALAPSSRIAWAALALAFLTTLAACGGSQPAGRAGSDTVGRGAPEFESGPDVPAFRAASLAASGDLSGRLLYVPYDRPACELRRYDLGTGEDESVGTLGEACKPGEFLYGFTASPDGSLVAWRDSNSRIVIRDENGKLIRLAAALNEMREDLGANFGPAFSPDSRYVGYCARSGDGGFVFRVFDARDGHTVSELAGTCRAALTAQGLAELRDGTVVLNGRPLTLEEEEGPPLAKLGRPYQIATDETGRRLALLTHGVAAGEGRTTAVVDTYDLEGSALGRFVLEGSLERKDITLWFGILRLAPTARSALVMWGCILQLAPVGMSARFPLLYGEDGPALDFIDYSPDGRFAVLGRREYRPLASGGETQETPSPLNAVVLDGETFAPRYRVPIHSEFIAWVG